MSREKKYWKSEIQLDQNNGLDHLEHNEFVEKIPVDNNIFSCLLYTSPSPRDAQLSRMPSSA